MNIYEIRDEARRWRTEREEIWADEIQASDDWAVELVHAMVAYFDRPMSVAKWPITFPNSNLTGVRVEVYDNGRRIASRDFTDSFYAAEAYYLTRDAVMHATGRSVSTKP